MSEKLTIDLDLTFNERLGEINTYARNRSIGITQAIRELVYKGLSHLED